MELSPLKKEITWFFASLALFLILLLIAGPPELFELVIAVSVFSLTWLIVSYSIKRFGVGTTDLDSLKKEATWFVLFLFTFLVVLVILGSPEYFELLLAAVAFTIIWVIRSALVKKFAYLK
ncbi:MAG: hypothetical protein ACXAD7_00870 [Candidatus Kariarchaeaceae archaeon]|jgi:hypothetical protein